MSSGRNGLTGITDGHCPDSVGVGDVVDGRGRLVRDEDASRDAEVEYVATTNNFDKPVCSTSGNDGAVTVSSLPTILVVPDDEQGDANEAIVAIEDAPYHVDRQFYVIDIALCNYAHLFTTADISMLRSVRALVGGAASLFCRLFARKLVNVCSPVVLSIINRRHLDVCDPENHEFPRWLSLGRLGADGADVISVQELAQAGLLATIDSKVVEEYTQGRNVDTAWTWSNQDFVGLILSLTVSELKSTLAALGVSLLGKCFQVLNQCLHILVGTTAIVESR